MRKFYALLGAMLVLSLAGVSATGGGHEGSFSFHKEVQSSVSVESSSSQAVAWAHEHSGHGHEHSSSYASSSEHSFSLQKTFSSVLDIQRSWSHGWPHWWD